MSKQNPIWQTATDEQLKHTMFKVTYKSGGIFIGHLTVEHGRLVPLLDENPLPELGGLETETDLSVTDGNQVRNLRYGVQSIEVVTPDDVRLNMLAYEGENYGEYERLFPPCDFYFDQLSPAFAVLKNGNRGQIVGLSRDGYDLAFRYAEDDSIFVPSCEIDYFLVKKKSLRLPDKSGLWKDKDGDIWLYSARTKKIRIIRRSGDWNPSVPEHPIDDYPQCKAYAPFTPWKPEAD